MTYTELKADISTHFARSDIATKIANWISQAEAYLFREISPNSIETSASGTTSGTIALPADFSRLIRVDLVFGDRTQTLDYTVQGVGFVIEGDDLRLVNQSDESFSYTLYYSPKLESLSDTVTTNWLLDNAKDLYFYAAVYQGAIALKDDAMMARVQGVLSSLLESAKAYAARAKYPQSGSLQIKVRR